MKNLAIIPARGGSKRIHRKNIKDFLGKPIIAYSIETALKSGLFDEVMVSTDDEEIADISKKYGASVPFLRSEENSDDYATLADVVDEVKQEYLGLGERFDYICCILATSPLITVKNLQKGLNLLLEKKADSVRPVVEFSYPIQRAVRLKEDGRVEMFQDGYRKTRSQDLEPAYHDAGQFYWMKFDKAMRGKKRFGFEIPASYAQDIDTEEDWKLTELKYKALSDL